MEGIVLKPFTRDDLSFAKGIYDSADNQGSIRLCSVMGYEKCAHYKQVGEKFGHVPDFVAYQKILAP